MNLKDFQDDLNNQKQNISRQSSINQNKYFMTGLSQEPNAVFLRVSKSQ